MPLISLETGLVVRRGSRTLEFVRLLEGNKVQFQDQRTHHVQTLTLSRFYSALQTGQLAAVLGEEVHGADLARTRAAPVILTDLSSLQSKERAALERRLKYVNLIRKRRLTRGQRMKIGEVLPSIAVALKDLSPPTVSTVLGWMRQFELSGMNPAALLSGNRCRRRQRRISIEVEQVVDNKLRTVYLTPRRLTLNHTLDQINIELKRRVMQGKILESDAKVSLSTVQRRLKEIAPYDRDRARYGFAYARSRYRTSVEGVTAIRPLQRLECDHTPLNWVVVCDRTGLPLGRPTLTIVVDAFSGYVVGLYVSFYGPGLTSVLNVIKNAIQPKDEIGQAAGTKQPWIAFGIGETIVLDNGLEFHSPQFQLAAWELGVDLEYCRVRTPWLKPKVERFFANLDHFTLTKGRIHKPLPNQVGLDPQKDASITFSDFVTGLIRFVVDIYPFELNSRRLQTPFELFKEGIDLMPPPTFLTSTDQLDLIAAMSKQLTVAQGGVEFHGLSYSDASLHEMKKIIGHRFKTLVKWNPDDLSCVYVQNPRNDAWLTVPSLLPDYTAGLSWIQHKLIRKHAREKHVAGGDQERLMQAKQELHELWMEPLARKNRRRDMRIAAKYSGLSSNQIVLASDDRGPMPPEPIKVLAREEVCTLIPEVPSYETFKMR
ncbi:putative transposase [Variovorax paradoxus]|uniref:Mu transposase C-terminal domain-containing protein n=1 Tax=Variovorax paradoxus TaxID=34073 RepID=UPI002786BEEF|nr:Mu transposase C-terminal domain-containing protein [Variovorax paradoxus]MDP9967525.1 putative transposase [Variovorax paradoxus]